MEKIVHSNTKGALGEKYNFCYLHHYPCMKEYWFYYYTAPSKTADSDPNCVARFTLKPKKP